VKLALVAVKFMKLSILSDICDEKKDISSSIRKELGRDIA
jgi:hypothetical protein